MKKVTKTKTPVTKAGVKLMQKPLPADKKMASKSKTMRKGKK